MSVARDVLSVSVVIPVFENVDFLAEALRSVQQQSHPPDEVIVVVDGPRVDLTTVLEARHGVQVLHRPRGGPGAARNTGCEAATGTCLAFLDSDDLWLPTKLERQLGALGDDPGLDVVFAGVEQFFSAELGRAGQPPRHEDAARAGILPSAMMVRTSSFRRVGGFREGVIFGELLDWYGRATDLGLRMTSIDEFLVRRRVHARNAGVQFRSDRISYALIAKELLDRRRDGAAG